MTIDQAHARLERARRAFEARPGDGWALVALQNTETMFARVARDVIRSPGCSTPPHKESR